MNRETFEELLHKGIVQFRFIKKDGSIRDAEGTLHDSILPIQTEDPERDAKTAAKRKANPTLVTYWDTGADGWRAFDLENLEGEPSLVEEL